ncbi:MAG TPA: amino acid permease, partial [Flavobacteriales bacterium]|nr:amino acid permease [Flavobacteriales bacterium]
TSAIAQCIQLPGISGKGNNLFLMEYSPDQPANRDQLMDNFGLLAASGLDLALLRSSGRKFGNKHDIHLWITPEDNVNSSLMILLAYILQGHPDWSDASISVFFLHDGENAEEEEALRASIVEGRLPIAEQNIEHVTHHSSSVQTIKNKSGGADLVILGFQASDIETMGEDAFERFNGLGEVMFVHGMKPLAIQ